MNAVDAFLNLGAVQVVEFSLVTLELGEELVALALALTLHVKHHLLLGRRVGLLLLKQDDASSVIAHSQISAVLVELERGEDVHFDSYPIAATHHLPRFQWESSSQNAGANANPLSARCLPSFMISFERGSILR